MLFPCLDSCGDGRLFVSPVSVDIWQKETSASNTAVVCQKFRSIGVCRITDLNVQCPAAMVGTDYLVTGFARCAHLKSSMGTLT